MFFSQFCKDLIQDAAHLCRKLLRITGFDKLAIAAVDATEKFWRGVLRELTGESNRIIVPVAVSHYPAPGYMGATSVPNPDNRLEFENSKIVVEGRHRDVHRVRCLDAMIGKLSLSFNEKAQEKIQLHIADVADSLQRIRAYSITADPPRIPVDCLEYSKDGQPIVKIKLGL